MHRLTQLGVVVVVEFGDEKVRPSPLPPPQILLARGEVILSRVLVSPYVGNNVRGYGSTDLRLDISTEKTKFN